MTSVLVALVLAATATASAQPEAVGVEPASEVPPRARMGGGRILTLDEVLRSVERHHPTLSVANQRIAAARGESLSAEGAFDLSLVADGAVNPLGYYQWGRASAGLVQPTPLWGASFYAGWRLGAGNVPDYYGERETLEGGELRLGASLPLWRGGPIDSARARRARAEQQVAVEESALYEDRLGLRLDAATAYYTRVAAGRKYRVYRILLEIAEARQSQIAAKVAAGHLPAIESLENRRVVVARRTALVSARRAVERASIALSLFNRGRDGSPRVPSPARMPTADLDLPSALRVDLPTAVRGAWARRPESARYSALTDRQEVSVELAENRRAPQIDFGIAAAVDVGSGTAMQQQVLGPATLEASLSFALPLQNRSARGEVARTRAELSGLSAEARLVRDRVEARVRDAYSAVRAAEESVTLAREAAEVAEAVAAAERTRFELGATQLFVVNLREEAAAAARAVVVDAEASLHVAHAAFRAATGELGER